MAATLRADAVVPAGSWMVDCEHSTVGFGIRHLLLVPLKGRFREFEGTLRLDRSGDALARGLVRTATIETGDATRDERLRGSDFFDAERWPAIRFASTQVEQIDASRFRIVGQLTIRDATRELELTARRTAASPDGIELRLTGELSRSAFGVESAQLLQAGISDRVELALRVRLVRAS